MGCACSRAQFKCFEPFGLCAVVEIHSCTHGTTPTDGTSAYRHRPGLGGMDSLKHARQQTKGTRTCQDWQRLLPDQGKGSFAVPKPIALGRVSPRAVAIDDACMRDLSILEGLFVLVRLCRRQPGMCWMLSVRMDVLA
jgi:hypothetical protein